MVPASVDVANMNYPIELRYAREPLGIAEETL
jgi:hypothetical protein